MGKNPAERATCARDRQRWADAQRRCRERARRDEKLFRLSLNSNFVALGLIAVGYDERDLTDHAKCEAKLAEWIEQTLEIVIDDSPRADVRSMLPDILAAMTSKVRSA